LTAVQTHLSPEFKDTADGKEAAAILRKCVHCGFCNATCPTYQLLGDELDGPRGRIYLIKQVLEGAEVTRSTQLHLDRCLTCLNCQTTCPSGVEYGHLVDIGRKVVEARVARPPADRAVRWWLKEGLTSRLFAPAMLLGRALRPILPKVLRDKVPARTIDRAPTQALRTHARKVLMLQGCVQPSMMPNIDRAAARVLDIAGIQTVYAAGSGCCGALRTHLSDQQAGLTDMRRNIDAWMPLLAAGAPGNAQPRRREHGADIVAARRMTGNDDRQQAGMISRESAMNAGGDFLLAGMCAGGEPNRARSNPAPQLQQLGAVERQRRGRRLDVAYGGHLPGAHHAEALSLVFVLGKAQIESPQHRTDQSGPLSPALVRTRR